MPNIAEKRQKSLHLRTLLYRFKFLIFCRPYFLTLLRLYDLNKAYIVVFFLFLLFVFVCLFACLLFNSYIHRIEVCYFTNLHLLF